MSSSPPSPLRRRLPLRSSGYIAPTDTSPDAKYQTHHNLYYNQSTAITLQTTSATCLQLLRCRRPLPQPVYSHQAADDLHYNLSTAIRLQTTSTTTATTTTTTTATIYYTTPHYRRTADAQIG